MTETLEEITRDKKKINFKNTASDLYYLCALSHVKNVFVNNKLNHLFCSGCHCLAHSTLKYSTKLKYLSITKWLVKTRL